MNVSLTTSDRHFSPFPWDQGIAWARSTYLSAQPCATIEKLYQHADALSSMAYHEMRLLLAKVMFNFDLELCPESEGWMEQEVYTLWQKKPLMVKLRAVSSI
jgi:hypothetical protein